MELPHDISVEGGSNRTHVLKLIANLYGQKQAGKVWYDYPSLNTLYNIRCGGGYSGLALPLRFCLVGVITSTNDKIRQAGIHWIRTVLRR